MGFLSRSCSTDLIPFCNKVTLLLDEGKAVNVYLDFSKAFYTASYSISWRYIISIGGILTKWKIGWSTRLKWLRLQSKVQQRVRYEYLTKGSVLKSILFNAFITDLNTGKESTLSKLTDFSKLQEQMIYWSTQLP